MLPVLYTVAMNSSEASGMSSSYRCLCLLSNCALLLNIDTIKELADVLVLDKA